MYFLCLCLPCSHWWLPESTNSSCCLSGRSLDRGEGHWSYCACIDGPGDRTNRWEYPRRSILRFGVARGLVSERAQKLRCMKVGGGLFQQVKKDWVIDSILSNCNFKNSCTKTTAVSIDSATAPRNPDLMCWDEAKLPHSAPFRDSCDDNKNITRQDEATKKLNQPNAIIHSLPWERGPSHQHQHKQRNRGQTKDAEPRGWADGRGQARRGRGRRRGSGRCALAGGR